jgi:flavin-binding protein dodecin
MAIEKAVQLTATGPTIEAAVEEALDRAASTLEGITRFEVDQIGGEPGPDGPRYRVRVTVWFTLLERMHG